MDFLTFLILFAAIATAVALASGVISMVHGGASDQKHSNQLMWTRVGLQGLAFLLLVVALLVALS